MGLTNSQYDAIMRNYSDIQSENKHLQMTRKREIIKQIPEYDKLDMQIADWSMQYASAVLGDETNGFTLKELQHRIQETSSKKSSLLTANGYPADYLDPIYSCTDCQDTGFINGEKCHCFKKAVIKLFYSQSNAKNIRKNETFDTFSSECYSKSFIDESSGKNSYDHMQDIFNITYRFAKNFGKANSVKNLFFYGGTGLGKTFLSNCIANELINSCHSVIYLTAIELFDIYSRSEFNKNSESYESAQEITDCDLLIIDDLGTELANSFTNSRLFYCINDRILKEKSTIISTNLTLDKLYEQYSERIFSRIMHSYKPLKFFGKNIRLSSYGV